MQTKVVIVYSIAQGQRRTAIIPDDDSQVSIHTQNVVAGEGVLVGSLSDYRTIGPDAMLERHLGRKPSTDRCAIVNKAGIVVGIIRADPAIDSHLLGQLRLDHDGSAIVGKLAPTLQGVDN